VGFIVQLCGGVFGFMYGGMLPENNKCFLN